MGSSSLRKIGRFLMTMALTLSGSVYAKTIYFGGTPETVPISYGTPTVLRFEEPVKTISNASQFVIKPVNDENPDYALLSVESRLTTGKADATFILASGEIAKLRISVVPRESKVKTESVYEIKSQKSLVESRSSAAPYIGRLELMTAMIRGDQVTGYEVTTPKIDVSAGSDAVTVSLAKVYSGDEFKGYVYEIKNKSTKKSFEVDIRKLQFGHPNLAVLAFSDLDLLEKSGSDKDRTRLVIVTKPGAFYRDAVLPIRVSREAQKSGGGNE